MTKKRAERTKEGTGIKKKNISSSDSRVKITT